MSELRENTQLALTPSGGSWTTLPQNPLLSSTCINSISDFPYVQNFEFGLNNWVHDPNNDFDWSFNYNSTPSVNTGLALLLKAFNICIQKPQTITIQVKQQAL